MTSPGAPKRKKITKRTSRGPLENPTEKKHKKNIEKKPVLAMEREARLNTILYKVFPERGERERESAREFSLFPCVLRQCFSGSSVLCESGSEIFANGSQDPLKMGPRTPPGALQHSIQKKGA